MTGRNVVVTIMLQLSLLLVPAPSSAQQTYDVNADFDATRNPSQINAFQGTTPPSPVWSYGQAVTLGDFTPYDAVRTIPFLGPPATEWYPSAQANVDRPDIVFWQGQLNLSAGAGAAYSVVRWTAPTDGVYTVEGDFAPFYPATSNGATFHDASVYVLKNGKPLFSGITHPGGLSLPYSFSDVALKAGDSIDFSGGIGNRSILHAKVIPAGATIRISQIIASETAISDGFLPYCSADTIHCEATTTNADGLSVEWKVEPDNFAVQWIPVVAIGSSDRIFDFQLDLRNAQWLDPRTARPSDALGFWVSARLMDGNAERGIDRVHVNQSDLGQLRQEYVDHAIVARISIPPVSAFTTDYPPSNDGWNTGTYQWAIIPQWAINSVNSVNRAAIGIIPSQYLNLQVNCVYRNPVKNTRISGSSPTSFHMFGLAVDFQVFDWAKPYSGSAEASDWLVLKKICEKLGFNVEKRNSSDSSLSSGSGHVHIQP